MQRFKHVKRGTTYEIISVGMYHMSDISHDGSIHNLVINGMQITATFQCSTARDEQSRYGGPIVIYRSLEDGGFWIRPTFEFFDGRFIELKD